MLALRLGAHPRWVATTTPRPLRLIKELLTRSDVVVTRGSTFENAANLAGPFLEAIKARYENSRLGRQELNAELLEDVRERCGRGNARCGRRMGRGFLDGAIVVGVDPSGTAGASDNGDSIGIVIAGKALTVLAYFRRPQLQAFPDGWGRRAVEAYREFKADRIIAERNFGGAMVRHDQEPWKNRFYKEVTASRDKIARAEPLRHCTSKAE